MTRQDVIIILSEIGYSDSNPPVYEIHWEEMKEKYKCNFPKCFIYYIEEQRNFSLYGCHLRPVGEDSIFLTAESEKNISSKYWDDDLIPFYDVGNGDLICLRASEGENSRVYYRYHEDYSVVELEKTFDDWLLNPDWHD